MLVTFSHILNILLKIDLILNLNLFIQITEEIMHNLFFLSHVVIPLLLIQLNKMVYLSIVIII